MAHGSSPGERRGGRSKGTPNKNNETIQEYVARMAIKPHETLAMISENCVPCPVCSGGGKFVVKTDDLMYDYQGTAVKSPDVVQLCKDCKGTGREAIPAKLRAWCAAELEQYVSAKLKSIEVTGANGGPIKTRHELVFVDPGFQDKQGN